MIHGTTSLRWAWLACRVSILLLAGWLATSSCWAQEWTRFRGPEGAGQSDAATIPATWTEQDYLWKTKLPGVGHASPVLWGDRIFVTSADPTEGTRFVLCVSASDGKLLWQRDYPAKTYHIHQQNSLASSTPTTDADHVYCAFATPDELVVLALAHDGREVWRTPLGPFTSQHGFGTSPILYEDLVILANDQDADSSLVALDRATGQVRWRVPRKNHGPQNTSYATPFIHHPARGGDQLIVASWGHGITCADPRSGKTRWEAAVLPRRPVGSPILVEGLILANCGEGSGNNNVIAVRPPANQGGEAEVAYQIDKTSAPYVTTLVNHGPLVFLWGDRGVVTCIDAASGKIHWRQRVGGNFSGSPVRVANRVYGVSATGEVVTLAAKDTFEELGRSELGEPSRATPAVALGRMFLRGETHLFAVGQK